MQAFAELLDRLYFTSSNLAKSAMIRDYLANTPDPDRGWAITAIAGELSFDLFKRRLIRDLIKERVDPVLFDYAYDYVGEMSETVALLWPASNSSRLNRLPTLSDVIERFEKSSKQEVRDYLIQLLDHMTPPERWALVKLGTRGLRIGVSARFMKKILAEYGNKDVSEIEALWHGVEPPYTELLEWLDGKAGKPELSERVLFHPVMLSHPLEENDLNDITPSDFVAEWKYDGIRVQLVSKPQGAALFSRTGDDISHAFPDLMEAVSFHGVLDGELLVLDQAGHVAPFNHLQQRLNRKRPGKKLMQQHPAALMLYDALELDGEAIQTLGFMQRREKLEAWFEALRPHPAPSAKTEESILPRFFLSELLTFSHTEELHTLREQADRSEGNHIEGLMLKRKDSAYIPGRPKGKWYKWKRDPLLIDAVMMYAQRGHGKRSSFYSDYTFGLWSAPPLIPPVNGGETGEMPLNGGEAGEMPVNEGEVIETSDNGGGTTSNSSPRKEVTLNSSPRLRGEVGRGASATPEMPELLPIGKAYSGFTDEELKKLDKWVRNHTINRYGPVREVEKALVLEVAFDSVHKSTRHKSGLALRFPRIHRIRWDKPANEADLLEDLKKRISYYPLEKPEEKPT